MSANATNRTLWIAGALSTLALAAGPATAQVQFDISPGKNISAIRVGGLNILTGGGVYGICSLTGADDQLTNWQTNHGSGGYMYNVNRASRGPRYSLTFSPAGNSASVSFTEGTFNKRIAITAFAMDWAKPAMHSWSFQGSRYRWSHVANNEGRIFNGNANTFASIPPRLTAFGYVGYAVPVDRPAWIQATGTVATVRFDIGTTTYFRQAPLVNHSGTNNTSVEFQALPANATLSMAGRLTVTPLPSPYIRFESERDFQHTAGIGAAQGDGWATTASTPAGYYASYGPYTTGHSGRRTAVFRLLVDNNTINNQDLVRIEVANLGVSKVIRRRDFKAANTYQNFPLEFTAQPQQVLEFCTYILRGGAYVRQDCVTLQ